MHQKFNLTDRPSPRKAAPAGTARHGRLEELSKESQSMKNEKETLMQQFEQDRAKMKKLLKHEEERKSGKGGPPPEKEAASAVPSRSYRFVRWPVAGESRHT